MNYTTEYVEFVLQGNKKDPDGNKSRLITGCYADMPLTATRHKKVDDYNK